MQPGEGDTIAAFGSTLQVKLGGEDTAGALTLGIGTTPPNVGPPLHVHHRDDEFFIVIEGEMEFCIGDVWHKVGPGAVVFAPKNIPHKFRNAGQTPSKHWVFTVPSGFDTFYRQCSEVFATGPDFAKIQAICKEHDVEILERPRH